MRYQASIKKVHKLVVKLMVLITIFYPGFLGGGDFLRAQTIAPVNTTTSSQNSQAQASLVNLEASISYQQDQIKKLDLEIAEFESQLDEIGGEKSTLNDELRRLEAERSKADVDLKKNQEQASLIQKSLQLTSVSIEEYETLISDTHDTIRSLVHNFYLTDDVSIAEQVLSPSGLSEAWQTQESRIEILDILNQQITANQQAKQNLVVSQQDLEEQKFKLEEVTKEKAARKEAIAVAAKEQETLVQKTANKEEEFQNLIEEKKELKGQFETELVNLEQQKLYVLNPNALPIPGTPIFVWPLERSIIITQPFGLTKDSQQLYGFRSGSTKGKHTGIDLRANGNRVVSMASGTVIDIGNTDLVCPGGSFGGWALIGYDNGLASIYSHLSSHAVNPGDSVVIGQLVGISGNTGYSTAPHLDVKVVPADAVTVEEWPSKGCPGAIYRTPIVAGSTYFDPLDYLPKLNKENFKYSEQYVQYQQTYLGS